MSELSNAKKWIVAAILGVVALAWWGLLVALVIAAIYWLRAHS